MLHAILKMYLKQLWSQLMHAGSCFTISALCITYNIIWIMCSWIYNLSSYSCPPVTIAESLIKINKSVSTFSKIDVTFGSVNKNVVMKSPSGVRLWISFEDYICQMSKNKLILKYYFYLNKTKYTIDLGTYFLVKTNKKSH